MTRSAAVVTAAAIAFRNALDALPPTAPPEIRLAPLRELAHLFFESGMWGSAEPYFAEAIEGETTMLKSAVHKGGRRPRVRSDLHPRHAYCLLQLEQFDDALVRLETGKARLLAQALGMTAARLEALDPSVRESLVHQHGAIRRLTSQREDERVKRFRTKLDDAAFGAALASARKDLALVFDQVVETVLSVEAILSLAPEEGALVAPVFTSQGSAVFVAPHGSTRVLPDQVLAFRDFAAADLSALIDGSRGASEQSIDDVAKALWDRLLGSVYDRLVELAVRKILLLPQGGLGLLPVHAAWRTVGGRRRFLADDIEITYAPSALAADTARRRTGSARPLTALVTGIQSSERFGELRSVESEVNGVAAILGVVPLPESEATPATVLTQSRDVGYIHLACHGSFNWAGDPLESALYLRDDTPLSLAEVIGRLELSGSPLVTLSACESGLVDGSDAPDEFLGLTAGFIQAGAGGVVSSLWRVDDEGTALLMERVYKNLIGRQLAPSAALREAQEWLRQVTRIEIGRDSRYREVLLLGRSDERPYSSPYHWAPFVYNGF